jgi:hypothetical protein
MEREDLEGDSRQREGGRRPVRLGGAHACLAIGLRLGVGSVARLGLRSGTSRGQGVRVWV